MNLKPQDVVVAIGAVIMAPSQNTYIQRAGQLGMSVSEIHAADKRLRAAGLMAEGRTVKAALEEFLVHGLRYVFVPEIGGLVRGMPTAHAGPGLANLIQDAEAVPVWPDPEGTERGIGVSPLYRSVPDAARKDPKLYELLALADVLRIGRARERKLAAEIIHARLREGQNEA